MQLISSFHIYKPNAIYTRCGMIERLSELLFFNSTGTLCRSIIRHPGDENLTQKGIIMSHRVSLDQEQGKSRLHLTREGTRGCETWRHSGQVLLGRIADRTRSSLLDYHLEKSLSIYLKVRFTFDCISYENRGI